MRIKSSFGAVVLSLFVCGCTLNTTVTGKSVQEAVRAPQSRGFGKGFGTPNRFELGLNKFDLALLYQGRAAGGDGGFGARTMSSAMARKSIRDAKNMGATFFRVAVTGYGPNYHADPGDLTYWISDPDTYWSNMDQMMNDLDAAQLSIVPSFMWNMVQFPAASGTDNLRDLMTNPSSASYQLFTKYVTEFITRYRDRESILFYEVGNELNLGADIDLVGYCRSTSTQYPILCEDWSNFTADEMITFTRRVAALYRSVDPTRQVDSGFAFPRDNAERAREHRSGADTQAEYAKYLLDTHQDLDIVSVHAYGDARFGLSGPAFIKLTNDIVTQAGKKLYIGEYGLSDTPAARDAYYSGVLDVISNDSNPVAYSSPWIFEFYQFAPDTADSVFNLEPGYTDNIISMISQAAVKAGSYVPPASPDATAPQVVLTVPTPGAIISGAQELYAVASDDSGLVSRVEFYADGALVASVASPPYRANLDVSTLSGNGHLLVAKAYDASGNSTNYVTQVSTATDPSAPSIMFTSNFQTSLYAQAGDPVNFQWMTTNAVSVTSNVQINGGSDDCGNKDGPWAINSVSEGHVSSLPARFAACQAGKFYTLTLTATSASGKTATAVNTALVSPVGFTSNGLTDITVSSQYTPVRYDWDSSGAALVTSTVEILPGGRDDCPNVNGPWAIDSVSGIRTTDQTLPCQSGYIYKLTVTATLTSGQTVSQSNYLTVQ